MNGRNKYVLGAVALAFAGIAGASCSTGSSTDGGPKLEDSLEIFSWWTNPGEVEALDALLKVYTTAHAGVTVTNAAAKDPTMARTTLANRMKSGAPPDSFQAISGNDILSWVNQGKMAPISDLAKKENW